MKSPFSFSAIVVAVAALASSGSAATFTDKASFLAAAGSITTEDFEGAALSGTVVDGAMSLLDFGAFSVSTAPAAGKIADAPYWGAFNTTTGGSQYLYLDTDLNSVGTHAQFTFAAPIHSVGFYYNDLFEQNAAPTITIGGQTLDLTPNTAGSSLFFGYTGAAFSSFSIFSDTDSAYGVDDVVFGVSQVPLPASMMFLLAGLGGLGMAARRRR